MKHLLVLILISGQVFAQTQPVAGTDQNLPGGTGCMNPGQTANQEAITAYNRCMAGQQTFDAQSRATQQGSNQRPSYITNCVPEVNNERPAAIPVATPAAAGSPAQIFSGDYLLGQVQSVQAAPPMPYLPNPQSLIRCRALEVATEKVAAGGFEADPERAASQDQKIWCVKKTGFTADWESCKSALGMYNAIVVMEAGLMLSQQVRSNNSQQNTNQELAQRSAQGDTQNAAFDAAIRQNQLASNLNKEQAMAYTGAVAALGSKIASWVKTDVAGLQAKFCGQASRPNPSPTHPTLNDRFVIQPATTPIGFTDRKALPVDCANAIRFARTQHPEDMIANNMAKGAFTTAAMMFAMKGVIAGIKANQFGNLAKAVEQTKDSTEDPYNPATFARCDLTPNDPACLGPSVVTPGSGLQDGGFSFGDTFGNSGFSPVGDPEDMTTGEPGPLAGDAVVPGTANPFADDAKVASGILDPAAAASIQPGGGAGGGAGGGGGAPGGGSASLGNDTPGMDDSKKESDIKANKAAGNYALGGGAGFSAVKGMKEENPFANLFDGKGGGKLEEDRSIASGDIDGKDSGIFAKISKRYNQVQADKRIEAKNLEE